MNCKRGLFFLVGMAAHVMPHATQRGGLKKIKAREERHLILKPERSRDKTGDVYKERILIEDAERQGVNARLKFIFQTAG